MSHHGPFILKFLAVNIRLPNLHKNSNNLSLLTLRILCWKPFPFISLKTSFNPCPLRPKTEDARPRNRYPRKGLAHRAHPHSLSFPKERPRAYPKEKDLPIVFPISFLRF